MTIFIAEALTPELAEKIAVARWQRPDWWRTVMAMSVSETDCFNVIAKNENDEVVGRLFCLQNSVNSSLWYYGDLIVVSEYRRRHIAEKMLELAEKTLIDRSCCVLRCYVEPENEPSVMLQRKRGFAERPYKEFDDLMNNGQLMFEKELSLT